MEADRGRPDKNLAWRRIHNLRQPLAPTNRRQGCHYHGRRLVKNVFSRRALGQGTRATFAGAGLCLLCAGPALAQEIHAGRPLLGLENAIKNVRFEAAADLGSTRRNDWVEADRGRPDKNLV